MPSSRSSCSVTSPAGGGYERGPLLEVPLHLGVDEVLHLRGMTDVGEPLLAVLAAGFDQQVAGAENAFEHALIEVDVVDPLQRDLDAALADDSMAEDETVRGDDEVGREPVQVADHQPHGGQHQQGERDHPEHSAASRTRVGLRQHDDAEDDAAEQRPGRLGEVPPVRVHVEGDGLVGVQVLLRERHEHDCSDLPGAARELGRAPSSVSSRRIVSA